MPVTKSKAQRKRFAATRHSSFKSMGRFGNAFTGFPRQAMRRMTGPPAALYPRIPTNATGVKSLDLEQQIFAIASSTSPNVILVPKQGATFYQRLGNRTRGLSLQLSGHVVPTFTNAAVVTQTFARIIVYYDRQCNGANPSAADLLTDYTNGGTNTDAFSFINMNNRDRFMILRDRKLVLPEIGIDGVASATAGGVLTDPNNDNKSLRYEEYIKLGGLESLYNTTNGGTIGDITSGSIGILCISTDASGTPGWQLVMNARFKFLD